MIVGLVVPLRAASYSGFDPDGCGRGQHRAGWSVPRSTWFVHRSGNGAVSHVEIRSPDYKDSLKGGTKTLFRFGRAGKGVCRLVVTEAPSDALSLAEIDGLRTDTLYRPQAAVSGRGRCPLARTR